MRIISKRKKLNYYELIKAHTTSKDNEKAGRVIEIPYDVNDECKFIVGDNALEEFQKKSMLFLIKI